MKIEFDKKDIITAINCEDAKEYINKKGYYGYSLAEWEPCKLLNVYLKETTDVRDTFYVNDHGIVHFCPMFIPADKVKKLKKQWRPFKTIDEFKKTLGDKKGDVFIPLSLGDEVTYRPKSDVTTELHVIFNGYKIINNQFIYVLLGVWFYYLKDLFDRYEFLDKKTNQWKLFGVQE